MIYASRLAGFFAAHAVRCVSDGDTLIPMLAYLVGDGGRMMERYVGENVGASDSVARRKLESNAMNAEDAALLYDGRITIAEQKIGAIIIEMRAYFLPESEVVIAVPYTPKGNGNFRVHRPKLLAWKNCDDFDSSAVLQSFFDGVDEHEEGSKIWNECLDESK